MKINRRQGLMAMVGSLFGGKDAAKSVISQAGLAMGEVTLKGGYDRIRESEGGIHGYPTNNIESYDRQIADLTKLINGGLEEWQVARLNDNRSLKRKAEMFRIDGLKSLAPHYKLSMIDRMDKQMMREEWIEDAKRELKNVLGYKENFLKSLAGNVFKDKTNNLKATHPENASWDTPKPSRG